MSNPTYDTDCPWEQMVQKNHDNRAPVHQRRSHSRFGKLARAAIICGALAVILGVLGLVGGLWDWLAFPASLILGGASCVYAGRLYQLTK